jgi:hypothetical protein
MIALAATVAGSVLALDLESGELEAVAPFEPEQGPRLNLPRLIASAQAGSTVVALVDAKPPLLVSHDAGMTWRESGRGLPPGKAVAAAPSDPDTLLYASRNGLYLSRNGGVFWAVLATDLPELEAVALRES